MSGFQNTSYGTTRNKALLDASVATPVMTRYGMLSTSDQPVDATPVTDNATEVYARHRQPKNVTGLYAGEQFKANGEVQYVRIIADGVKTVWDEDEVSALINLADVGTIAALAADEKLRLRNIVLANGSPLTPLGNDGSLVGGDFLVIDNSGTKELHLEKVGGGAFGAGTCIDVHMDFANTEIRTYVLPAGNKGVPQDGLRGADFWTADEDTVIHKDPN